MPKSKDTGRNAKPLWNVPEFVDKASQHWADVQGISWSAALYQLAIIGYQRVTTEPERYGNLYLFNSRLLEDAWMDEFEAQTEYTDWLEFLLNKAVPKQGRPPKTE